MLLLFSTPAYPQHQIRCWLVPDNPSSPLLIVALHSGVALPCLNRLLAGSECKQNVSLMLQGTK